MRALRLAARHKTPERALVQLRSDIERVADIERAAYELRRVERILVAWERHEQEAETRAG